MNQPERDELLGRLDERTKSTLSLVERQEKHLAQLNEKVVKNTLNIDRNCNRITELENILVNGISLKFTRGQKATGSVVAIAAAVLAGAGKLLGWW